MQIFIVEFIKDLFGFIHELTGANPFGVFLLVGFGGLMQKVFGSCPVCEEGKHECKYHPKPGNQNRSW